MALSKMARAASKILPIRKQVLHGEDDSLQKNVAIRALLIFASNNYTCRIVPVKRKDRALKYFYF